MLLAYWQEQRRVLIEALSAVEGVHNDIVSVCPWCDEYWEDDESPRHKSDCKRQLALAAVNGDPNA